jgi:hypothetical protein
MYRLYRVGARTEPCDTPACISRGVGSSPLIIIPNFLLERDELISFVQLDEKWSSDSL